MCQPAKVQSRPTATPRPTRRAAPWTQPGGWADCAANSTWSFTVPTASSGAVRVSLPLPAALVKAWAASGGDTNYGLLFK